MAKHRRCRIEDIYAVAEALGESLYIQERYRRPIVGDGMLILTKNASDTRWYRALSKAATRLCHPRGRLKETTTLQGAALFYFGDKVDEFSRLCEPFGHVWRHPSPDDLCADSADSAEPTAETELT